MGSGKEFSLAGKPWLLAVNFINPHDIMFFMASEEQRNHLNQQREDLKAGYHSFNPFINSKFLAAPSSELYAKSFGLLPATLHAHSEPSHEANTLPSPAKLYQQNMDALFGVMVEGGGAGLATTQSKATWSRYVDYYLNCLRDVDKHIGQVLDALDAAGLTQSTIVILTSDHGEMAGEHGLRQKDGTIYKENINVPFLIRPPDSPQSSAMTSMVSSVDIAPTLLAVAGVDDGERAQKYPMLPGHNLLPLVFPGSTHSIDDDRALLFQYGMGMPQQKDVGRRPFCQAILTKQYKFGRWFAGAIGYRFPSTFEHLVQTNNLVLYDRVADPMEIQNL